MITAKTVTQYVRLNQQCKSVEEQRKAVRDEVVKRLVDGEECSHRAPWLLNVSQRIDQDFSTAEKLEIVVNSLPEPYKTESIRLLARLSAQRSKVVHQLNTLPNPGYLANRRMKGEA